MTRVRAAAADGVGAPLSPPVAPTPAKKKTSSRTPFPLPLPLVSLPFVPVLSVAPQRVGSHPIVLLRIVLSSKRSAPRDSSSPRGRRPRGPPVAISSSGSEDELAHAPAPAPAPVASSSGFSHEDDQYAREDSAAPGLVFSLSVCCDSPLQLP